nr:response regulator [Aliivibrio fischeri]
MASTTLEQLFKPFVQADSSITRKYGGTGLGLAIIKRLVELMQGTITVESRLNVGSTFKITLPLKEISDLPKQLNNEAKELVNQRSLNILLAEDNKANQAVLQILLEKQGHHVSIVSNGEEAISIFKHQTNCRFFDVVLMDVSMPVKDGISATTELRKLGIKLPIIAITAHAMETEKEMCLAAGMNDFISKPIRAKDLSDILIKYSC